MHERKRIVMPIDHGESPGFMETNVFSKLCKAIPKGEWQNEFKDAFSVIWKLAGLLEKEMKKAPTNNSSLYLEAMRRSARPSKGGTKEEVMEGLSGPLLISSLR